MNAINTYQKTTKMNFLYVKTSTYFVFEVESNYKNTKFQVGDHVKISKHKNIFAKDYTQNCSEKVFVFKKKLKNYCGMGKWNKKP